MHCNMYTCFNRLINEKYASQQILHCSWHSTNVRKLIGNTHKKRIYKYLSDYINIITPYAFIAKRETHRNKYFFSFTSKEICFITHFTTLVHLTLKHSDFCSRVQYYKIHISVIFFFIFSNLFNSSPEFSTRDIITDVQIN